MSKQDVKQAINETIGPNGKRAITGQSLANLLHMMVDEGGSGGSGFLQVKLGNIETNYPVLSAAEKEHNKQIFETAKNAVLNGEPCPMIAFDMAPMYKAASPELSMYLTSMSLMMFPMVSGYVAGPLLVEEIGYTEAVYTAVLMGVMQIMILSDGSVILTEG